MALTRAQAREFDRRAWEEFGVPGIVLMENAGRGVAVQVRKYNPEKRRVVGRRECYAITADQPPEILPNQVAQVGCLLHLIRTNAA